MTKFSKTTLTASVGALAIAASFAVSATPAAAGWHGHGYGYGIGAGLLGIARAGNDHAHRLEIETPAQRHLRERAI